jgi:hypothetical protein
MSKTPTLRSRVWNLLGTARTLGRAGVTVAALALTLGATPDAVLTSVMPDMLETPEGETAPALYCEPASEGATLTPRRFPG